MRHVVRKHLYALIYGIVLTAYFVFTLLDAFVIPKDIVTVENYNSQDSSVADGSTFSHEPVVTDTSYTSDDISISITTVRQYNTNIYIADVVISSIGNLRTGLAQGSFGRNITDTTSNIASECNAILAINGDYYGFRDTGMVIRNSYLYRSSARSSSSEALAIYENGNMCILNESEIDADNLLADGVVQLFSFGPGLIKDGSIAVSDEQEVEQSMRSNPRTAIGMISPLHYIFVVSDGRTSESTGLSLSQLAQVMLDAGCTAAYNLDGGGSSTMWFMGNIINNPTTNGKTISERKVSDIVYVK